MRNRKLAREPHTRNMPKVDTRTIRDFDEQWSRYSDNSGFYGSVELFADIIHPLLEPEDFQDRTVVEIGSGTGRIVKTLLECGAHRVYAVEPASGAFSALKQNTRGDRDRIEYVNALGENIPPGINADFVLSIGVIHHIENPRDTMRACLRALRPGGQCLIWLYGKEGNELYLRIVNPLRRLTARLPHAALAMLCQALNALLSMYIGFAKWLPLPLRDYVLNVIGRMSREKRYLVIYDQLNPAYAKYYTEAEAQELLRDAGFTNVRKFHRRGYSWTVIGTRPA